MAYVEYEADGKTIKARVQQKTDTLANWMANPMPLKDGEAAFVITGEGQPLQIRLGWGGKRFSELPNWIDFNNAQRVSSVAPGVLPAGPADETKYMEVTAIGTYTYGGNTLATITEDGYKATFWWTGSAWVSNGSVRVKGETGGTVLPEYEPKTYIKDSLVLSNKFPFRAIADTSQIPSSAATQWDFAIPGAEPTNTNWHIWPLIVDDATPSPNVLLGWDRINQKLYIPRLDRLLSNSVGVEQLQNDVYKLLTENHFFTTSDDVWAWSVRDVDGKIIIGHKHSGEWYPDLNKIDKIDELVENLEVLKGYDVEVRPESRLKVMEMDKPWEAKMIGYYSVMKISNELQYMWYNCWQDNSETDFDARLCFAFSEDGGRTWIKKVPGRAEGEDNIIINRLGEKNKAWFEIDVFKEPSDSVYPYRMIYNRMVGGVFYPHLAKSTNGWDWEEIVQISTGYHDAQYSFIEKLSNGNYYILCRMVSSNRDIGELEISPSGELIKQSTVLKSRFSNYPGLYTSAGTKLPDGRIIIFPTLFKNDNTPILLHVGFRDEAGRWVLTGQDISSEVFHADKFGFATACPNMIPTGVENERFDEYYLYYNMRVGTHQLTGDSNIYKTDYFRIKVRIKK